MIAFQWADKDKGACEVQGLNETYSVRVRHDLIFENKEQIVQNRIKQIVITDDYDSPSWAYKQADRNGYNRALTEIINILHLDQEVK